MKNKIVFPIVQIGVFLQLSIFNLQSSIAQSYFQQEVNYTIHVSLNDSTHELSATAVIEYTNHSSTALTEIYFHLWANGYKDETTALAKEFEKNGDLLFLNLNNEERGSIDSLDFKADGKKINWKLLDDTIDICKLFLEKPLHPGEKIIISTPFHVKLPSAYISRSGHAGQAYSITQWFPKPAVYDKNGWNYFSYINWGEFYSEFGTIDVFITLPENYVVGATGDLVNGEKELSWLEAKVKETKAITSFSKDMSFPPSSSRTKTLHYHLDKTHDFAWFADKRWHVLNEEIELPQSKRKVTAWMMFTNAEAAYWMNAPGYMKASVDYFSQWIGDYPYNQLTMVDVTDAAGNGMEYPTIATIGNYGDLFELELTIAHEIAHNWLYGILGTNERLHPWMDEGMTNFFETRYVYTKYAGNPEKQLEGYGRFGKISKHFRLDMLNHRNIQYLSYLSGARRNTDQPPETPSEKLSYNNYRGDVYYKTAISFDFLKSYLGDSLFDLCMNRYYDTWKFKHPQPEDLKAVFATTSGKNLDWMFDELIKTTKKTDYKICCVQPKDDQKVYCITIENPGTIASPLSISSLKNGLVQNTHWLEGFKKQQTISIACTDCDAFRIDAEEKMPELQRKNNTIRTNGMFKKTEPVRFQFLGGLEEPSRSQIFYSPVLGWNNYNKLMAGAAFYNIFIPEKKFEYVLMPMYSFRTKDLTGGGTMACNFYPASSRLHKVQLSLGAQTYSYMEDYYFTSDELLHSSVLRFGKVDSRIRFFILPEDRTEKTRSEISLRNIFIRKDLPYDYNGKPSAKNISMYEISFNRNRYNKINPAEFTLKARGNNNLLLATLEEKLRITYASPDKGFDIRLFAGTIFHRNTTLQAEDYRFQLSGHTGSNDYLFDEVFMGRTDQGGILSRQYLAADGGFAAPAYFYRQANKWMVAVNLKTTLPGILPFRLYANTGTFDQAADLTEGSALSYEIGVEVSVIKNIFTLYFPIVYSDDIQYVIDREKLNFGDLIRFELHLNKLNPLTLIKQTEL